MEELRMKQGVKPNAKGERKVKIVKLGLRNMATQNHDEIENILEECVLDEEEDDEFVVARQQDLLEEEEKEEKITTLMSNRGSTI